MNTTNPATAQIGRIKTPLIAKNESQINTIALNEPKRIATITLIDFLILSIITFP